MRVENSTGHEVWKEIQELKREFLEEWFSFDEEDGHHHLNHNAPDIVSDYGDINFVHCRKCSRSYEEWPPTQRKRTTFCPVDGEKLFSPYTFSSKLTLHITDGYCGKSTLCERGTEWGRLTCLKEGNPSQYVYKFCSDCFEVWYGRHYGPNPFTYFSFGALREHPLQK